MSGILQANLNHASGAQDLFIHSLAELNCGLGIVAEPYRVPDNNNNWARSEDGSAAIVRRHMEISPPLEQLEAGNGYVTTLWGSIVLTSVYLSPSLGYNTVGRRLDALARLTRRHHPRGVVIAGDFNAKSGTWGSPVIGGVGWSKAGRRNAV